MERLFTLERAVHGKDLTRRGALHIVVERILQDNTTFYDINWAGHQFKYAWTDTKCNPSVGISKVADLLYGFGPLQNPIDVLFGPVCSVVYEPVGYLARDMGVLMNSSGCYTVTSYRINPSIRRLLGQYM